MIDQQVIQLPNAPIIAISRVSYGNGAAFDLTYTGSGVRANASVNYTSVIDGSGSLRLTTVDQTGASTKTDFAFDDYTLTGSLVDAINASAPTGWVATLRASVPTAELNPIVTSDARNRTVCIEYPDQDIYDYVMDFQTGVMTLKRPLGTRELHDRTIKLESPPRIARPGMQQLLIEYRAGYESIPEEISVLADQAVQAIYYQSITDPAINSTSLGPYSVSFRREADAVIRELVREYKSASSLIG